MQQDQHSLQPNRHRPTRLVKDTRVKPGQGQGQGSQWLEQGTMLLPRSNGDAIKQQGSMPEQGTMLLPRSKERAASQGDASIQPTVALGAAPVLLQANPPGAPVSMTSAPIPDTTDISEQSTAYLQQLSGMMRAVIIPQPPMFNGSQSQLSSSTAPIFAEEFWPQGIQHTGPLPVVNLYGQQPFGMSLPVTPALLTLATVMPRIPAWKSWLHSTTAKIMIGLAIGIGLLVLVAQFVNVPATLRVLQQNLATPRGVIFALLSGVAFLIAFSIRGIRWKLFLNPIGNISTLKSIQLFLVGIFLNFLLPIRGGEVAKSLMLRRIAGIPVSKSLPTVAIDKALDLLPALVIMVMAPLLGVTMDVRIWLVLGLVGVALLALVFFTALAAWKRAMAIALLHKMLALPLLPRGLSGGIERFATGFIDSLLAGASRPRIFVPAVLLTCIAIIFDGLFAMLAFWTIGFPITFGTAIFGYAVYNMFYILPTPPGQVGSNEAIGLLVFAGLLHLPVAQVTAMFVFSHPWAALLMCVTGMACLSALGFTISSAMKVQSTPENLAQPTVGASGSGSLGTARV